MIEWRCGGRRKILLFDKREARREEDARLPSLLLLPLVERCIFSITLVNEKSILPSILIDNK